MSADFEANEVEPDAAVAHERRLVDSWEALMRVSVLSLARGAAAAIRWGCC